MVKRRSILHLSHLQLGMIECFVILRSSKAYDLVIGSKGLYYGLSGLFSPTTAADDLRKQREGLFTCSVIVGVQPLICRDNADQRDIVKIQPLCDHLCPDHQWDLLLDKPVEQDLMGSKRAD